MFHESQYLFHSEAMGNLNSTTEFTDVIQVELQI